MLESASLSFSSPHSHVAEPDSTLVNTPARKPPTEAHYHNLKRKSSCLSSPPPEPNELQDHQEEEGEHLSKRRQLALPTKPITWYGRGRSPFTTPATAALDNIKGNARLLEHLEKELIFRQEDLEKRVEARRSQLDATIQRQSEFSSEDTNPFAVPVLPSGPCQSRSISPTKLLGKLANGKPPIIYTTLSAAKGQLTPQVQKLNKYLAVRTGDGYLSRGYEEVIEDLEPNYPVLSSAWSNMPSRSPAEMEYLWEAATDIKASAQECQEERRDENAWSMNVARPMLEWETSSPGGPRMKPSFSRTECIQTQSIEKSSLPEYDGDNGESKKADFALSFSPRYPQVKERYDALRVPGQERPSLSQMSDECTSKLGLYLGAEVKKAGERENVAQGQLFTWLGSGIIKARKLRAAATASGKPAQRDIMPLLGWTVVGYEWKLYVAFGAWDSPEDTIRIVGPIPGIPNSTESLIDVFKMLQLVECIKQWVSEEYWPWFRDDVMKALER